MSDDWKKERPERQQATGTTKLFEDDFFIPVPGELYNDMEDTKLTPTMWCVYSMILRQVDFETGFWQRSAYKIHAGWGGQIPLRTVQENLKKLYITPEFGPNPRLSRDGEGSAGASGKRTK